MPQFKHEDSTIRNRSVHIKRSNQVFVDTHAPESLTPEQKITAIQYLGLQKDTNKKWPGQYYHTILKSNPAFQREGYR